MRTLIVEKRILCFGSIAAHMSKADMRATGLTARDQPQEVKTLGIMGSATLLVQATDLIGRYRRFGLAERYPLPVLYSYGFYARAEAKLGLLRFLQRLYRPTARGAIMDDYRGSIGTDEGWYYYLVISTDKALNRRSIRRRDPSQLPMLVISFPGTDMYAALLTCPGTTSETRNWFQGCEAV